MPITVFRCSKCRREFDLCRDAENCESSHPEPIDVKTVQYTMSHTPYAVEVTFSDGTKRLFNAADFGG